MASWTKNDQGEHTDLAGGITVGWAIHDGTPLVYWTWGTLHGELEVGFGFEVPEAGRVWALGYASRMVDLHIASATAVRDAIEEAR